MSNLFDETLKKKKTIYMYEILYKKVINKCIVIFL